jgi:RNA polymerase sigma-70 factor (ECF subfamily)
VVEAKLLFWNPPLIDPLDEVVHRAEDRELLRAVLALPFKDRQAIYLHYFDGLTFAEVGEVLGVSEIAARVRVHRALQRLRGQLGPDSVAREVPA